MTDDPGPEYWARQSSQLPVINAMQQLMDAESDRFTGMSTQGSGRVTLYVVDMSVLDEQPLRTLLDDARAAGIEVDVAPGTRSLRELNRINDEIIRTDPCRTYGVRAAEFGIDPISGTIWMRVAASAVEVMRKALAAHGDAVVVSGVPFDDSPASLPPYDGPRDGWREPPSDLIGRPTDVAVGLLRDEGFEVEVYHRGDPALFRANLNPNRVRLLVHDGRVLDARQA